MDELNARAVALFNASDYAAAKPLFAELCSDCRSSNAKFYLAQCALKLGETGEGIKHLKDCIWTSSRPYLKAYVLLGDLTGAANYYRDGASLGEPVCAYKYGVHLLGLKNVEKAASYFEKCIRKENTCRGDAFFELGVLYLKSPVPKRQVTSVRYFVAASQNGSETAADFLQQISIHAEQELDAVPSSPPINSALRMYQEGDKKDAVKELKKDDVPTNAPLINYVLGLIYLTLEDYAVAFKCLHKAASAANMNAVETFQQMQSFLG